jgi:hypothetical protein
VPLIIIAGVLGAIALGKWIEDLVCHHQRRGMIIDATGEKLKIRKDRDLPGGTIVVIGKDGGSEQINACDEGVELGALVSALKAGASAAEAIDKAKPNGGSPAAGEGGRNAGGSGGHNTGPDTGAGGYEGGNTEP